MNLAPDPLRFDALEIGARGRSGGRTLSEADLTLACMMTGGWQPMHADAQFAAATPLGRRILHGNYCLMLATGMAFDLPWLGDAVISDLGVKDWRYLRPVHVGDTVHVEVEIVGKRVSSDPSRGVLERRIRLLDSAGGTPLHEGISALLVRREADAS